MEAREQELAEADGPPAESDAAEQLAQLEAKLAELREAEQAFVRTHAELAARSDQLAERETELAARERALAATGGVDLEELELRIRRLEERSRNRAAPSTQTFSEGLRQLQERSRERAGREGPRERLH